MLERLCLTIAVTANLQLILAVSFTFSVTVPEKVINYTLHTTLDTVCGIKPGQFRAQY